jgi:two-component sensor histidine kinase
LALVVRFDVTTEDELRLEFENVNLRRLLVQAGIDAAEYKAVEQLQRILVEELHHRVKNTLATVIAITSQSLRSAESLEQGKEAIENRLLALGRVHDLLLRTHWTSASLAEILKTAIEPFDTSGGGQFFVQSSDIDVSAGAVLPLAMVLNELCTNAAKYGALSNASGRIDITATVDEAQKQFRLIWTESGGPPVHPPSRRGFGTRLIEHSFVRQLQAAARQTFEPLGVTCVLDVPLASLKPIDETDSPTPSPARQPNSARKK